MKITLQHIEELSEKDNSFEKFTSKKRKLSATQNVRKLISEEGIEHGFNTADLEELRDRGILDDLVKIIKSGKEASVYLGRSCGEYIAVKVYTDLRVRSFRRDDMYREGRFVGDARLQKAMDQGSATGLSARQILWVQEEFRQLYFLYNAGIPVPKPIATSGKVVLMEFIGSEGEASERLSDIHLEKDEAEEAFRQSVKILEAIVSAGRIHGDYSAYNILWDKGRAVVIDFPQVVGITSNRSSREILLRDVNSLCKSFKRHKIYTDPEGIYKRLLRITGD
ncbi:MAG: RIO1 family regulatory kinase/ATPase [Ignavibacteria bacterium]